MQRYDTGKFRVSINESHLSNSSESKIGKRDFAIYNGLRKKHYGSLVNKLSEIKSALNINLTRKNGRLKKILIQASKDPELTWGHEIKNNKKQIKSAIVTFQFQYLPMDESLSFLTITFGKDLKVEDYYFVRGSEQSNLDF